MDWVKLLTEFDGNPKILSVGLAGAGLYARSLAYCGAYETDGFIPDSWVTQAVSIEGKHLPEQLVGTGLWKTAQGGYEIPDYTDVNQTKGEYRRLRASRSRAGKKGGKQTRSKREARATARVLSNSPSNSPSTSPSVSLSSSTATGVEERVEVNRKLVTDDELELAIGIIDEFNYVAGTSYTPSAHLKPVVGRIREHPELDLAAHQAVIAASFRDPWWDRHPSPAVIYGNAAQFERQMQEQLPAPRRPQTKTDKRAAELAAERQRLEREEQHGAI